MGRVVVWALVLFGAFVAVVMVAAAVSGSFTEKQQMHLLGWLFWRAFIVLPLVGIFAMSVHEYRQSRHWVAFIRSAMMIVAYAGAWAWFGYFGDHGAFFLWPVIVGAVLLVLAVIWGVVDSRLRKEYLAEITTPPAPPANPGAATPGDFKDWS